MASMIKQILTDDERRACWRLGMFQKFAQHGIRPQAVDATIAKMAGVTDFVSPTNMAKTVATVSILTGVPLGVAAYLVGKRVTQARGKEKELQAQTGYYRNAASQLEQGLAAGV